MDTNESARPKQRVVTSGAEATTYTSMIIAFLGVMRFRSQTASHLETGSSCVLPKESSQQPNSVCSALELRFIQVFMVVGHFEIVNFELKYNGFEEEKYKNTPFLSNGFCSAYNDVDS